MLRRLIGEHIELTAPVDPNLDPVLADRGQIEQILVNLVVNARDAMPEGGRITIETANVTLDDDYVAQHPEATPGRHAMLAVTDTGIGMTAETSAQVFEPFFTTKPVGAGTGLGLSTVYGIVKQSGGNVWIYSEPGRGSSFKVYLPTTNSPATHDEALPPHKPAPCGTETILLAEDEPALRTLTARMLTNHGYTVIPAESPERALEIAADPEQRIDLLLTDLVMPQIDGHKLAQQITTRHPHIRVLFMSGYADQAILADTTLDLEPFLEKPFSANDLAQRIRDALDTPLDAPPQNRKREPAVVTVF
jgi:CheY-like chemotaxis protein